MHLGHGRVTVKTWNLCLFIFTVCGILGAQQSFAASSSSRAADLRIGLSVGGVYEFFQVGGTWFGGGGPSVGSSLEFGLGQNTALGIGARYRTLAALGPNPTANSASIIEASNTDLYGFLRLGWVDILGGMTRFSGKLLLLNGNGREIAEDTSIPLGGLGFNILSTNRLRGRLYGIYTFGDAFGYSMTSVQVHGSLSILLP